MSDYEGQLLRRWEWERQAAAILARANKHLRERLHRSEQQCRELENVNANLRVERDAADILLGEAMDELEA